MALVLQAWVLEAAAASLRHLAPLTVGEGCCYIMKMSPIETMCYKWCPLLATSTYLLPTLPILASQTGNRFSALIKPLMPISWSVPSLQQTLNRNHLAKPLSNTTSQKLQNNSVGLGYYVWVFFHVANIYPILPTKAHSSCISPPKRSHQNTSSSVHATTNGNFG